MERNANEDAAKVFCSEKKLTKLFFQPCLGEEEKKTSSAELFYGPAPLIVGMHAAVLLGSRLYSNCLVLEVVMKGVDSNAHPCAEDGG